MAANQIGDGRTSHCEPPGWAYQGYSASERWRRSLAYSVSLPVCPECGGSGTVSGWPHTPWERCPACGGSGVDITEAVEAAYEVLKPYLAKDMPGWVPGWQVRVARRVALAVLDKEGTSVVSGEGE